MFGWRKQEELKEEVDDKRYLRTPYFRKNVDGGSMLDLIWIRATMILLFWVSSQCQSCHEWAEGIRDSSLNYSIMQPITIHEW